MIPPIAPPSYDNSLPLFDNLSQFYCWYRQYSRHQPKDIFYRLMQIAKSPYLSDASIKELSTSLNDLSDALCSSSIQVSAIGDILSKMESKILQINPKAALVATSTSLELRTNDTPIIAKNRLLILRLLQRISVNPLNDLQAKLISRHLNAYLCNPVSIKSLVEISVLLKHWFHPEPVS